MDNHRSLDSEIFALAIPAFATLVSEPLLLMADSAIIGHLGTTQLAGLGIAANVLGVLTGLCLFLAYGTTATVARKLGARDLAGALSGGFDGLVLAVVLGLLLCSGLQLGVGPVISLYGVAPDISAAAHTYLRISALGLPSLLVMLASTGVLRGLQDTRTPLYVAVGTNLANIGLNVLLVYGFDLGIAGAATGTVISQTAAAIFLTAVVLRGARRVGAHLRLRVWGVLQAAREGFWLLLRTLSLQIALTATTVVAAAGGAVVLGSHQIANSIWVFLAFALDAIAIAAQAIIGRYLGAEDVAAVRALTRRMIGWGFLCGVVFGVLLAVGRPLYIRIFTPDQAVRDLVAQVILVIAITAPIAGIVMVLDGVLIGAGDGRYLAVAGFIATAVYLPLAIAVDFAGAGLVSLWIAYMIWVVARAVTLALRARGTRWMRTGATISATSSDISGE